MVDARMARQGRASFFTKTGHNIERPIRQTRLLHDPSKSQRRQASLFGGLQDTGIARGQRRPDGASNDLHGIIPWHDMAGHPVRLAQGIDGVAFLIGDRLPMQLIRSAPVKFQITGQGNRIIARLAQRLAHIERLHPGKRLNLLQNKSRGPQQHPAPLQRGGLTPYTLPGRAGRIDSGIDICGTAPGDLAHDPAGGWVFEGQCLAGIAPMPCDQHLTAVPGQFGDVFHACSPGLVH